MSTHGIFLTAANNNQNATARKGHQTTVSILQYQTGHVNVINRTEIISTQMQAKQAAMMKKE